jgi:FAD/FMN-containing dehydrogenase
MTLLDALRAALGPDADAHLLTDHDLTSAFGTDWTRRWSTTPAAVVRPGSVQAVADCVRACAEHRVPLVPQGGNTGLVGASVPHTADAVVLSTARLDHLEPVDTVSRQVTVGAGVTLATLQQHARSAGLLYAVDTASRDTATIGGTVATNAGGLRVCRYGDTKAQVVGLRAVLADGSVLTRLNGLPKDGAGYDLVALLVGSEGTLGVVTDVRVRLHPVEPPGVVTLVGCATIADAVALVPGRDVRMAELMTRSSLALTCEATGLPHPLARQWPAYLLLETPELPDLPEAADAVVDERLVAYRERHTEAVSTLGVAHKLDVALPLGVLDDFVERASALAEPHRLYVFGHLAEGNLHLELVGPDPDDDGVDAALLRLAASMGGTIASEHGVGAAKASLLGLSRDEADLAAMRAIKHALDPWGILNPGAVLAV